MKMIKIVWKEPQ